MHQISAAALRETGNEGVLLLGKYRALLAVLSGDSGALVLDGNIALSVKTRDRGSGGSNSIVRWDLADGDVV